MSLTTLCTRSVTIERKTTTVGAGGAHSESFATAYSGLQCTIQPIRGKLSERFARMSIQVSHVLYTPTVVTVQSGDRVVDGSDKYIVEWGENQADRDRVFAVYLRKTD